MSRMDGPFSEQGDSSVQPQVPIMAQSTPRKDQASDCKMSWGDQCRASPEHLVDEDIHETGMHVAGERRHRHDIRARHKPTQEKDIREYGHLLFQITPAPTTAERHSYYGARDTLRTVTETQTIGPGLSPVKVHQAYLQTPGPGHPRCTRH